MVVCSRKHKEHNRRTAKKNAIKKVFCLDCLRFFWIIDRCRLRYQSIRSFAERIWIENSFWFTSLKLHHNVPEIIVAWATGRPIKCFRMLARLAVWSGRGYARMPLRLAEWKSGVCILCRESRAAHQKLIKLVNFTAFYRSLSLSLSLVCLMSQEMQDEDLNF